MQLQYTGISGVQCILSYMNMSNAPFTIHYETVFILIKEKNITSRLGGKTKGRNEAEQQTRNVCVLALYHIYLLLQDECILRKYLDSLSIDQTHVVALIALARYSIRYFTYIYNNTHPRSMYGKNPIMLTFLILILNNDFWQRS